MQSLRENVRVSPTVVYNVSTLATRVTLATPVTYFYIRFCVFDTYDTRGGESFRRTRGIHTYIRRDVVLWLIYRSPVYARHGQVDLVHDGQRASGTNATTLRGAPAYLCALLSGVETLLSVLVFLFFFGGHSLVAATQGHLCRQISKWEGDLRDARG